MIRVMWQFACIVRNEMPLRITQQDYDGGHGHHYDSTDHHEGRTVLKVEGSVYLEDAELLERICYDIANQTAQRLTLDLADISFLDSDSASVLCRLKREQDVALEGLHLFIAKVIELTEAEATVSEYLRQSNDTTESDSDDSFEAARYIENHLTSARQ